MNKAEILRAIESQPPYEEYGGLRCDFCDEFAQTLYELARGYYVCARHLGRAAAEELSRHGDKIGGLAGDYLADDAAFADYLMEGLDPVTNTNFLRGGDK